MRLKSPTTQKILIATVVVLITLNVYTFISAYPETYTPSPGITTTGSILAKDFSAYYVSAYRLWNNPSQIYHFGALSNEPITPPHPEAYKYLPSFLLFISPLLSLDYQQALWAFDLLQLMLLPLIGYILYKLLDDKHVSVAIAVMAIALLMPFPTAQWGLFPSYYWQWGEGQAKVLLMFLLLLSFYFGKKGKPIPSGIVFALGFFDVRFGLLALPLFVMYNREKLKVASASAISALSLSNIMLLYPVIGSGFVTMVFDSGLGTPIYFYAFIPFFTLLALIVVNFKKLVATFDFKGFFANFTRSKDVKSPNLDS
jgi:hypothetical protein